jgi:hypothetical protein
MSPDITPAEAYQLNYQMLYGYNGSDADTTYQYAGEETVMNMSLAGLVLSVQTAQGLAAAAPGTVGAALTHIGQLIWSSAPALV